MALTNYWLQLIWMFAFGAVSYFAIPQQEEMVLGERCIRWRRLPAFLLALPYVLWAAWRPDGYGDTSTYRGLFLNMAVGLSNMSETMSQANKGPAFIAFEYLFKTLISRSDVAFFFVIAFIQMVLLAHTFRKYSINYWLSMFFFVASTDYMSWMHNGIRQFLAVTIIFSCIHLIVEKKYWLMCLVVLLCAPIHSASLIFLPFIFVINGRAWNMRTLLFLVGLIVSILLVDRVSGFIVRSMEGTAYDGDIEIFLNDDGTNIIRVMFYGVPTLLSWVFRDRIYAKDDPMINLCANLSIIATGVYVFSYFTSGILVGALPIYFSLANYILIPWLIDEIFDKDSALFIQTVFVVVYSVFFYYQMGIAWQLL